MIKGRNRGRVEVTEEAMKIVIARGEEEAREQDNLIEITHFCR